MRGYSRSEVKGYRYYYYELDFRSLADHESDKAQDS